MTFWGISATGWSALTAIGTMLLAIVTVGVVAWTNFRDNRLRATDELSRADAAARLVRVDVPAVAGIRKYEAGQEYRELTVFSPRAFPRLLSVEGCILHDVTGHPGIVPIRRSLPPLVKEESYEYTLWAPLGHDEPIIRFTDWTGNQYYQRDGYTARLGPDIDWLEAARLIDGWINDGQPPKRPPGWTGRLRRRSRVPIGH